MKNISIIILFFLANVCLSQTESKPKINAVGLGTVNAFPNAAQISIALYHVKPTLRDAMNENQKTMDEVLKIVKNYVVDSQDIMTSLISTNKATRWDNKQDKEIFIGFASSQKLVFTLRDLKKMQDFTEELLKTKFNKLERI